MCLPPQQGFLSFGVTALSPAPQARQYFRLCGQCSISVFVFYHHCSRLPQTQRFKATCYFSVLSDPTGSLPRPPQGQRQGTGGRAVEAADLLGGSERLCLHAGRLLAESSHVVLGQKSPCPCRLTAGSASLAQAPCPACPFYLLLLFVKLEGIARRPANPASSPSAKVFKAS